MASQGEREPGVVGMDEGVRIYGPGWRPRAGNAGCGVMKTWATFSIRSQKGQEIGTEELNLWSNVCVTGLDVLVSNSGLQFAQELENYTFSSTLELKKLHINKHIVTLLCHTTSIGIPSKAMSLWALKP